MQKRTTAAAGSDGAERGPRRKSNAGDGRRNGHGGNATGSSRHAKGMAAGSEQTDAKLVSPAPCLEMHRRSP